MIHVEELEEEETEDDVQLIKINQFKQNLLNTDYKVIKNLEVFMLELYTKYNIELPYAINELHEERQGWRNGIETAELTMREGESG